jgi:hypothetical protein
VTEHPRSFGFPLQKAIDRICDYYSSLEKRDVVSGVEVGYLAKAIPSTSTSIVPSCSLAPLAFARLRRPRHSDADHEPFATDEVPKTGEDLSDIANDFVRPTFPMQSSDLCLFSALRARYPRLRLFIQQ